MWWSAVIWATIRCQKQLILWYIMVWYDILCYIMVSYNMIWYGMIALLFSPLLFSPLLSSPLLFSSLLSSSLLFSPLYSYRCLLSSIISNNVIFTSLTFVDSHTECYCSDYNSSDTQVELLLSFAPLVAVHARMIAHSRQSRCPLHEWEDIE